MRTIQLMIRVKREKRKIVKEKLALGELENEIVTVEVEEQQAIYV